MIVTELYNGQGLGNQLWCYVVARVIADKKGYEFGIQSKHKFKGYEFIKMDFGKDVIGGSGPEGGPPQSLPNGIETYYKELTIIIPNGAYISKLDQKLLDIEDNTKIDGIMQSYDYIKDYKEKILSWIQIENNSNVKVDDDVCLINVRGGDFLSSTAVLYADYYNNAINVMKSKGINKFLIVTDDPNYSRHILPNIPIHGSSTMGYRDNTQASHHIGGPISIDFNLLNTAKHVIISASSFSWWAVWLNKNVENVIAPKYWAANKSSDGYWSCGDSLIDGWEYLHKESIYSYDDCLKEKEEYEDKNKNYWLQ